MRIIGIGFLVLMIFLTLAGCDQLNEPYKTPTRFSFMVLPQSTDDSIQNSAVHHYAFVDTRIPSSGKLLIFLGSTGSLPQNYASINKVATNLGHFVINVSYLNAVDGQACSSQTDAACYANYHEEMLFGEDKSALVSINKFNSISYRILTLLYRLHKLNPHNGWNQFYEGNELLYSKFILAGHGQGGGHAAYLAQKFAVDRLVLFSSPNDFSEVTGQPASWLTNDFATDASQFYGLTHKRDEVLNISKQYAVWQSMGMLEVSDTTSADNGQYNSSQALITNFEPNKKATTQPFYRNLTAQEYALPAGADRIQLKLAWQYLLAGSPR